MNRTVQVDRTFARICYIGTELQYKLVYVSTVDVLALHGLDKAKGLNTEQDMQYLWQQSTNFKPLLGQHIAHAKLVNVVMLLHLMES